MKNSLKTWLNCFVRGFGLSSVCPDNSESDQHTAFTLHASSSVANTNALEIAEFNWKLKVSDEELDRINGRTNEK